MFLTSYYKKNLKTRWLGSEFLYHEQLESTNSMLKQIPDEELVHGMVLLAESQLKGRGQYGREWVSEPGKNLTFTIALKPENSESLSLLTLAAEWGIIRALERLYGGQFYLKWPNDLMVCGKKLGGMLTENIFNGARLERVLIGIGLNIEQSDFPDGLLNATSLALEFDRSVRREEILCRILEQIEEAYDRWQKNDRGLIPDINEMLEGFGEWVRIRVDGETQPEKVKFLGVNEQGFLVILTPEIEVKMFTHEHIRILRDD